MIKKSPDPETCTQRRFFLNKGREAFSLILKQLLKQMNPGSKILLPSYIGINDKEGSGVFDPVEENRLRYEFYQINEDLSVDFSDFLIKIKDPEIKIILIIHYFGFPSSGLDQLVKICKRYNKYLVEDCAHSLCSEYNHKRLGSFGDASFFSLHKVLPINGGGMLQINNSEIKDPEIVDTGHIKLLPKFDLEKISKIRRENYAYLLNRAQQLPGIKILFPELPVGVVPLNFPILITERNRDEIYFKMQERGIELVSLYYRIIDRIGGEYTSAHYLSKHITSLPLHQSITFPDIDRMVRELAAILRE